MNMHKEINGQISKINLAWTLTHAYTLKSTVVGAKTPKNVRTHTQCVHASISITCKRERPNTNTHYCADARWQVHSHLSPLGFAWCSDRVGVVESAPQKKSLCVCVWGGGV